MKGNNLMRGEFLMFSIDLSCRFAASRFGLTNDIMENMNELRNRKEFLGIFIAAHFQHVIRRVEGKQLKEAHQT